VDIAFEERRLFQIHRSNRTEHLVDALARVVGAPLADPFARECIVVHGRGMERWLAMELARRLGVWANGDFPFPRRLVEHVLTLLGAPAPAPDAFDPDTLVWAIAARLTRLAAAAGVGDLAEYLREGDTPRRRVDLADRIARAFDDYVVYRGDLLARWENGAEGGWQARLWRSLVDEFGAAHAGRRAATAIETLRGGAPVPAEIPERVSVFGVSTLAPLYLDFLAVLGTRRDVHVFLLCPSEHYWADVRARRQALRAPGIAALAEDELESRLSLEEGHPLLASLGRIGRDFQGLLEERAGNYEAEDVFAEPNGNGMLAVLQRDILRLRAPGEGERLALVEGDMSIQVHSCHAPMREVEVLRDLILAMLDADPTLQPRDVVVMTPSIAAYAPLIEAVFCAPDGEARTGARSRLNPRIADRGARAGSEVFDAFARLIDVLRGRLGAAEVFDLLRIDVIRRNFALPEEDLERVRDWIEESGVRWGIDAAHRAAEGQPAEDLHTWRFGLDRLLLGYAIGGEERELFSGVLPYADVEGAEAQSLGRLAELCERLFQAAAMLRAPRTLARWCVDLERLLERFIVSDTVTAHQHQAVREALRELAERAARARFDGAVDVASVVAQVERALERDDTARGFLNGGLTFCELVPMRSIPFRVVCLLGMNHDAFPRRGWRPDFDEIGRRPRRGDRSARDDDRYLFLEALLSARDTLVISYVGQSVRDNSALPPSVVVSEVLDTLERTFAVAGEEKAGAVAARVTVRHPLQPFSPRYFDSEPGEPLFSYSTLYLEAARGMVRHARPPRAFAAAALPPPQLETVDVDELARFFENPSRAFLQKRLGVYLGDDAALLESRDPVELNALEKWTVGDFLLRRLVDDAERDCEEEVRAAGLLPLGSLGSAALAEVRETARCLVGVAARWRGAAAQALEVRLPVGGLVVTGALRDVFPEGLLRVQYSKVGKRQEVGLWVRHLVLSCVAAAPVTSRLVGRAQKAGVVAVSFAPVADAPAALAVLVDLYRAGQIRPLPLFQEASRCFADLLRRDGNRAKALRKAVKAFEPNSAAEYSAADAANAYVRQIFGEQAPFAAEADDTGNDSEFERVACAVYGPLLAARGEES